MYVTVDNFNVKKREREKSLQHKSKILRCYSIKSSQLYAISLYKSNYFLDRSFFFLISDCKENKIYIAKKYQGCTAHVFYEIMQKYLLIFNVKIYIHSQKRRRKQQKKILICKFHAHDVKNQKKGYICRNCVFAEAIVFRYSSYEIQLLPFVLREGGR